MIIKINEFSPEIIADSGQCFRMTSEDDVINLVARDKFLSIKRVNENTFDFSCDKKEYDDFWSNYFDTETSYKALTFPAYNEDSYVKDAVDFGYGMKILNQDPFEMLISFILSQRKSIPAIRSCIEKISAASGKKLISDTGKEYYAFPTPEELASLSTSDLDKCGLGYRTKYVEAAVNNVISGNLDLVAAKALPTQDLMDLLMSQFGVGIKVASCVALFGYHRLEICPVDVWMNKIINRVYNGESPFNKDSYIKYAGVLQQYMFFYERSL